MLVADALSFVAEIVPAKFESFQRHIDPSWIEEALCATGVATMRRRRLPADQVIWIVIAMALFRDRSVERLVASLDLSLPAYNGPPVSSAITLARKRLGSDPLEYLFATTGSRWAEESARRHSWRGLSIFAYDGSSLTIPDSPENRAHFGSQVGRGGQAGYPAVRVVTLLAARSHVLAAMRIGPYTEGEVTLAEGLWREVPDNSLTIVDRGLMIANELISLERAGENRHWLSRVKRKDARLRVVTKFRDGSEVVELPVTAEARRRNPALPESWRVRRIRYQWEGKGRELLTSLLDPDAYPAAELVALYHERWEQEIAYDEIKTHLLGREEAIRSRTPTGVRQELYGIGLAYNLIRREMEQVADIAGVAPTRVSFVMAVQMIRDEWLWCSNSTPGAIPKQLQRLRDKLRLWILPPRRPSRRNPRAVKVRMTRFPRKKLTKRSK